jgi:tRNA(Ile)-lysidine synthase
MNALVRVRRFIEEHALLRPRARLVVGVSGGPDSLCLLDLLHRLEWGLELHVAHLNHGLRPDAARDAEFVRAEAVARGLSFHLEVADTRAHAAEHRLSIEEAARELRYACLNRVAVEVGAATLAVAHTADDQAETVLMHFLRGSGAAGLRGMLPQTELGDWRLNAPIANSPLTLVRPLLGMTRAEVEAYCLERSLRPIHDATNADTTFFRNRLRHELLPTLESYNPNIRAVLTRTAEVMAGEYELLQQSLAELWADYAQVEAERVAFERARWQTLTVPAQRALLRRAVQHLRPGLRDVDFAPLEAALQFSQHADTGRACDVTHGLCLAVDYAAFVLRNWDAEVAAAADVPLLTVAGALSPGWWFHAEPVEITADIESASSRWRVFVDAAQLLAPPTVRARLDGDRFQPLGMNGHSLKLSDFMINRKVPAALRERWPLVVSGVAIVWVAGLQLDDRFKITPATQRVLKLEFTIADVGQKTPDESDV